MQDIDDDWHKAYAKFKEMEPMDVRIDFVGVWYVSAKLDMDILRTNMSVLNLTPRDTVPSVGDVLPRTLPFSRSNTSIRVFRHALALHEPRVRLHPKFYEVRSGARDRSGDIPESNGHCPTGCVNRVGRWPHQFDTQEAGGADITDVQEVWFAGSHWGTCLHHASWVRFRIRTPTLESTG